MSLLQRAKAIWPGLSTTEMDTALWACTTYPMGSDDEVLAALKDAYRKSGGDLWQALNQADAQRTANMIALGR